MKNSLFATAICAAVGFCVYAEGLVSTQLAPRCDVGISAIRADDPPEAVAKVGNRTKDEGGTATFKLEVEGDYVSFDHALAGATYTNTSKTGTIKPNDIDNVKTFAAPAPVVQPGEQIVCDTAEAASNVMAKAKFMPSAEVAAKLESDEALKIYRDMFTLDVVPTADGKWAVAAFLLYESWTNVVMSAQDATRQIPVAKLAAQEYGKPLENVLLTNCVPGFFYSLFNGATMTDITANISPDDRNILCGTNTTVVIPTISKPGSASGFFLIGVREFPSVVPGEFDTYTNIPHRKPTFPIPPGW